jgi:hypothetical protein
MRLTDPVTEIKGVGQKTAAFLEKAGIGTVEELLKYYPRDYKVYGSPLSVDDFVISYFTTGSGASTLAMEIYAMTRKRISPEINALSTLLFALVLTLLAVVNIRSARQERAAQRREALLRQKN